MGVQAPPPRDLTTEERAAYQQLNTFYAQHLAYAQIMSTRPQTLYVLADSPADLAAFMLDLGDGTGQPGLAGGLGQGVQYRDQAVADGPGVVAGGQVDQAHIPAGTVDQGAHGRLAGPANDQVSLPVAYPQPQFGVGRSGNCCRRCAAICSGLHSCSSLAWTSARSSASASSRLRRGRRARSRARACARSPS
jgi:hypothetical protein